MRRYAIIGAGGFGREIMPLVLSQLRADIASGSAEVYFAVEGEVTVSQINGVSMVSLSDFANLAGKKFFNVAIADAGARARIASDCESAGLIPFTVRADTSHDLTHNSIGSGAILCPFTMITSNARVGKFFHANIYSYVAHDCVIGDFVTFAPAVRCNGNIRIEDHAYIGTAAVLRPGSHDRPLVIGASAIVGMGSVVTRDVPPHVTVVGNPARPLLR